MIAHQRTVPTILVLFGATGDLMKKKIVPALYHLYESDRLPALFHIIGFSRRDISTEAFRKQIAEILREHDDTELPEKTVTAFLNLFSYHQGNFSELQDYQRLAIDLGRIDGEWKTCANKLFYLAVPPLYYQTMLHHLADSGLTIPCGPEGGWTRVLVEKPFGKDLKTAEELDLLLAQLFKEEQIYRIDHYLAKEMLQNILTFRFSNNLMESSWNNRHIEKIEIKLYESIGVEKRGSLYDGLGALKDVGQNHLLQMLALITMSRTSMFDSVSIRKKRSEILKTLIVPGPEEIVTNTIRGQYEGYTSVKSVQPTSQTETYFKVIAKLDSPRWQGVPIIIEAGKELPESRKEIIVTFKHLSPCLCPDDNHYKNTVIFSLEPEEKITICFWSKKPGLKMELEEQSFEFNLGKSRKQKHKVEEYERLLLDCIDGNQLLFVSTDEVKAMWRFIDPIVEMWSKNTVPLIKYKKKSSDILNLSLEEKITSAQGYRTRDEIGVIGLGKMGKGIARHLLEQGWHVVGYNRTEEVTQELTQDGLTAVVGIKELVDKLKAPRVIWLMLPAGKVIDEYLFGREGVIQYLEKGDIVIDAANSFYKDTISRAAKARKKGITYIDVGVSGGPGGARYGACLMVGGDKQTYDSLLPLYVDLSVPGGVQFCEGTGAGHFVKMVHNGIEYGMMQAIAEGFAILKKAKYKLNLEHIADIYNHGSVIESKLMGWLQNAFHIYGPELKKISGTVAHTGEGAWTVNTAREMKIAAKVIEDALTFRIESEKNPSYTGQVVSALRNQFGGHNVQKK